MPDVKLENIEKMDAPVGQRANLRADTSELERQIDALVYQLYGLTEEEKDIVEGKK
jgi:hypothetical protein